MNNTDFKELKAGDVLQGGTKIYLIIDTYELCFLL
jgi:hypothetical protein